MSSGVETVAGARLSPADDRLLGRYYDELRRIARRTLRGRGANLTVQPTELVHEALLRLLKSPGVAIADEKHFLALSARAIRMTLVDEVRRRRASKRDCELVTIWPDIAGLTLDIESVGALVDELAKVEPVGARIVELRFFVGLTMDEIAPVLGLSESTTLRRWRLARAWLLKELEVGA